MFFPALGRQLPLLDFSVTDKYVVPSLKSLLTSWRGQMPGQLTLSKSRWAEVPHGSENRVP